MGIKWLNRAALLDFPNFTGLINSSYNSQMGDFRGSDAQRFCPLIYERPFHNVSLWERVFLGHRSSCEVVITPFGHYDAGVRAWCSSWRLHPSVDHKHSTKTHLEIWFSLKVIIWEPWKSEFTKFYDNACSSLTSIQWPIEELQLWLSHSAAAVSRQQQHSDGEHGEEVRL